MRKLTWLAIFAMFVCGLGALLSLVLSGPVRARPGGAGPPAVTATPSATPAPICGPGAWTAKAPYPNGITGAAVAGLGGRLYSFGGNTGGPTGSAFKYDPCLDSWTAIAALPAPRDAASAVTDGTYLYILNGDNNGYMNTLYRYDPVADSYTTLAPAPVASKQQAAVYLGGKIYRIAGYLLGPSTPTVDVYTIGANSWAPPGTIADYPEAVGGLLAVAAGGYIYTASGATQTTVSTKTYRYDPAGNTWDDAAVPDVPTGHFSGSGDILNGRWILAGGFAWDYQVDQNVIALDLSNPAGGWTELPWEPAWRWFMSGASVGDAFYTVGGADPSLHGQTDTEQYRDSLCTPTPTGTPPTRPPTVTPTATGTIPACGSGVWGFQQNLPVIGGGGGAAAQGGALYTFGGFANGAAMANAYRYSPNTDSWTPIHPLPVALSADGVVSDGTYLYIANGSDLTGHNRVEFYRYDPATDSYSTLAPAPRATWGQALVYLNGQIYRIGGATTRSHNSPATTDAVDLYTISSGTWAPAGTISPYPQSPEGLSAVAFGGYIYAAGGSYGGYTKSYRYDPAYNTWDDGPVTDLPQGFAEAGTGVLNGRWYLAGGAVAGYLVVALDLNNPAGPWTYLPSLPRSRDYPAAGVVAGAFYVVGGLANPGPLAGTQDNQRFQPSPCFFTPTPLATPTATITATPAPPSPTPPLPTGTAIAPSPASTRTPLPTNTPPATGTPCSLTFRDVHPSDYFYTPVAYLACHGVISGYGDGTYRPYAQTTRAQLVKIVVLGFQKAITTPPAGGPTFADVPLGFPFFTVIETAAADGIVSGYGCGGPGEPCDPQRRPYFRPYALVTRGQLSKIDVAAAGWPLLNPPAGTFADVAPGSPFFPFVETAAGHGVISGYACGGPGEPCDPHGRPYFRTGNFAIRGQIAKIVFLSISGAAGP